MSTKRAKRQPKAVKVPDIELERMKLFQAMGVLACARGALCTTIVVDNQSIVDAIAVAFHMIDEVAEALERQALNLRPARFTLGERPLS